MHRYPLDQSKPYGMDRYQLDQAVARFVRRDLGLERLLDNTPPEKEKRNRIKNLFSKLKRIIKPSNQPSP
jgi:hypothetical protein